MSYVRNGFGEVIQEVSADAGATTYTRDLRGLVTQVSDGRGVVTNRTYDNAALRWHYGASAFNYLLYTKVESHPSWPFNLGWERRQDAINISASF